MNTISATAILLTHSLAWALLYSLWQGALISGTLFVVFKAVPSLNSRLKYVLSFGALVVLSIWFAGDWMAHYHQMKRAVASNATESTISEGAAMGLGDNPEDYMQHLKDYTVSINTNALPGITYTINSPVPRISSEKQAANTYLSALEQYVPFIMLIYCMGLAFMLFRFCVNMFRVGVLGHRGLFQPDLKWTTLLYQLQKQLGIYRPVKLHFSNRISVPMMMGVLKPVILLPVTMLSHLSAEQVEAILLHELAHIKRHDYLMNIFQSIVETVLFFNPFVWFISSIIRREREFCCDDMVVSTSRSPLPYAKALATLVNNHIADNSLALAATGQKKQLFHRIKRIMEMKKTNTGYGHILVIIAAIVAITLSISLFTFSPLSAKKFRTDPKDTVIKKSKYVYKSVTIDSNGRRNEVIKESADPLDEPVVQDTSNGGIHIHVNKSIKKRAAGDPEDDEDVSIDSTVTTNGKTSQFYFSHKESGDGDIGSVISEAMSIAGMAISKASKALDSVNRDEIKKSFADADRAMAEAKMELRGIDWDKLNKEINEGVKDMQLKLKEVDWDKINREIEKSLREVNKELNDPKLRKEISEDVRKGLEQSKKALKKAVIEINKSRPKGATHMGEDEEVNSSDFDSMVKQMGKDGLLNPASSYKIKKENNELYINGKKQPESVYKKYQHFLEHKTVKIDGSKGNMNININN